MTKRKGGVSPPFLLCLRRFFRHSRAGRNPVFCSDSSATSLSLSIDTVRLLVNTRLRNRMGHSIHVIAATHAVIDSICKEVPQLRMLRITPQFAVIPVDFDLIDEIVSASSSQMSGDEFEQLTPGFLELLRSLSRFGRLAYLETEYHGGQGGQGALVCFNRDLVMPPTWSSSDTINQALELIGVPEPETGDRFSAIGLDGYRRDEQIISAINNSA
jgi:hypothetical protein